MKKRDSNIPTACGSLILVAALAIAGCKERDGNNRLPELPETCPDPCNIDIELPVDFGEAPNAPDVTVVEAGSEVNFRLPLSGGQPAGRTVLSFEEAAFVDNQQNKIYTLELRGAANRFTAGQGVCPEPKGCRYVVINIGRPGRPSVISSPRFVIK